MPSSQRTIQKSRGGSPHDAYLKGWIPSDKGKSPKFSTRTLFRLDVYQACKLAHTSTTVVSTKIPLLRTSRGWVSRPPLHSAKVHPSLLYMSISSCLPKTCLWLLIAFSFNPQKQELSQTPGQITEAIGRETGRARLIHEGEERDAWHTACVMWCDVMWCDAMWCDAMRCDVM